jgi:HAD superfamily hydrolase (TIGR01509 family)
MLAELQRRGLGLAVATNSIRKTTEIMLNYAGVLPTMNHVVTNEDVRSPKPDPEIYLLACAKLGLDPNEVLVVEDNVNGVKAAKAAGCSVLKVEQPSDLDLEFIDDYLKSFEVVDIE